MTNTNTAPLHSLTNTDAAYALGIEWDPFSPQWGDEPQAVGVRRYVLAAKDISRRGAEQAAAIARDERRHARFVAALEREFGR